MHKKPAPTKMFSSRRLAKALKSLLVGPEADRRRVLLELTRIIANLLGGHYIGDDYKIWLEDREFVTNFKRLSPHNYYSMERKFALRELAKSVSTYPGCAAECGSYVGASAWFIARELPETPVYLFDSFEGLPEPTELDRSPDGVQQWNRGEFSVDEEIIRSNLKGLANIRIMKGWIPDRFPDVSEKKFKLVHIDVDLYEPTFESLEFFYHRMVSGGVIVMDDYGFRNCPGAYHAARDFIKDKSESIVHLPTGQGIITKHH